jgi:hypothetical protein
MDLRDGGERRAYTISELFWEVHGRLDSLSQVLKLGRRTPARIEEPAKGCEGVSRPRNGLSAAMEAPAAACRVTRTNDGVGRLRKAAR